jgi:myo-inositol 2-dehydrogenase / D-chiro-inositol 1-dehydrogenase
VRLGIIGCGYVTLDRHLPALRRVPEIEVVAVADAVPERATDAARRTPRAHAVGVDALLGDGGVEAVAVCTPPATHAELALAALDAGKHLFLEKPVAPSLEEADRIAERAARSPLQVLVGFNFRRHRLVERARQMVMDGRLGRVQAVRTAFTSPVLDEKLEWKTQRGAGGGALIDRAVHHFDLWRFVLRAEVAEVFAVTRSEKGDDQSAVVTARTTDGTPLSTLALDDSVVTHDFAVYGSDAALFADCCRFDGFHVAPRAELPGSPAARLRRAREAVRRPGESYRAVRSGGDFRISYVEEWRHFARVVSGEVAASPTLADGRAALEIALAAARSADSGSSVPIGAGG